MSALGPHLGDSAIGYDAWRRRRTWAMRGPRGLDGYAAYLHGFGQFSSEAFVGGVTAAEEADAGRSSDWLRPVLIGVVTSAAALIVNRWIERTLLR